VSISATPPARPPARAGGRLEVHEAEAEARRGGCGAEAGDVNWLLFINAGYVSRMVYFLHARVTYFVLFRVLARVIYLF
jgi:hypothetical protein